MTTPVVGGGPGTWRGAPSIDSRTKDRTPGQVWAQVVWAPIPSFAAPHPPVPLEHGGIACSLGSGHTLPLPLCLEHKAPVPPFLYSPPPTQGLPSFQVLD